MARYKLAETFTKALQACDRSDQKRFIRAVEKFSKNPALPGLGLEKLRGHENLWSIRASKGMRILLSKQADQGGDYWVLENAGPHDIYRREA